MQDFRKLLVWQRAHQLALETYRITNNFPKDEIFGLRHVMRKTSIDIPGYLAESSIKSDDSEAARCVSAALGFANRLEYYALMARDLGFLTAEIHGPYENEIIEVKKMMGSFKRRLLGQN